MNNPFAFLITQLFELYIYVVLIRFFLQAVRADFYNPVSQFVVKATNPILIPLRKIIPGFGGFDIAAIVFAYGLNLFKFIALSSLNFIGGANLLTLALFSLVQLLTLTLGLFIFLAFIRVILSWISPGGHNPMVMVIIQLTDPLFRPFQRLIPPMGGLDISPILMFIALYFSKSFIEYYVYPLVFGLTG